MPKENSMYDPQELEELRQALEKWRQNNLQDTLARIPERQEEFITTSSEPIERLYTPLDMQDMVYMDDLGLPGEYPFTRGVHPTLHRGKLWTMRMFAGFGTAEETNARFKYLLDQGQTGLSIAFDLPTLMGLDTDAPEALGEFGKCGVAVSSLKDMEILLHHPERHSQGIYRPKRIHLPSEAFHAPGCRHHRVWHQRCPRLEYDQHLWLPHPGGWIDSCSGAGFHPGGRHGVCALVY
jgi:hypothetical protein